MMSHAADASRGCFEEGTPREHFSLRVKPIHGRIHRPLAWCDRRAPQTPTARTHMLAHAACCTPLTFLDAATARRRLATTRSSTRPPPSRPASSPRPRQWTPLPRRAAAAPPASAVRSPRRLLRGAHRHDRVDAQRQPQRAGGGRPAEPRLWRPHPVTWRCGRADGARWRDRRVARGALARSR